MRDAVIDQRVDFRRGEPGERCQHLGGVLAEQGSARGWCPRGVRTKRRTHGVEWALQLGVGDGMEEAALVEVAVRDDVFDGVDGEHEQAAHCPSSMASSRVYVASRRRV